MKLREIILRRKLKRTYLAYKARQELYDCGNALAEHICLEITKLREKCNDLINKINAVRKPTEQLPLLK